MKIIVKSMIKYRATNKSLSSGGITVGTVVVSIWPLCILPPTVPVDQPPMFDS